MNYCDLPLWDMVFGTFRNPRRFEGEAGFWDGASSKLGPMLIGKEIA
jgi:sterol desaturase/sphingolipid hydroxylase (fatty acid hydroxylase superfamily)